VGVERSTWVLDRLSSPVPQPLLHVPFALHVLTLAGSWLPAASLRCTTGPTRSGRLPLACS
jgi:hypothetical protein